MTKICNTRALARIWIMFSVMGGLKSLAAVVLIKIKIVLVVAAIVAVVVFTIKYLLGATGLSDLGGLLYKANSVVVPSPPQHPPVPSYLPVVHEPVYGHGKFVAFGAFSTTGSSVRNSQTQRDGFTLLIGVA